MKTSKSGIRYNRRERPKWLSVLERMSDQMNDFGWEVKGVFHGDGHLATPEYEKAAQLSRLLVVHTQHVVMVAALLAQELDRINGTESGTEQPRGSRSSPGAGSS